MGQVPSAGELAAGWVAALGRALDTGAHEALGPLFADGALWKDLMALGPEAWTGPADELAGAAAALPLEALVVDPRRSPPRRIVRAGDSVIEAFVEFRMPGGTGEGVVRLTECDGEVRAAEVFTVVRELDAAPERVGARRPGAADDGRHRFDETTWYEERARRARFDDREPEVLIVGAGQAGLALAARLGRMGIDALVVEREQRIGDTWRRRYRALRLHNAAPVLGLPYLTMPETWETFLSKDRIADYLSYYADAMDIACWTSTTLESAHPGAGGWVVTVRDADHRARELRPRHLVMATGLSGAPRMPRLPGLDAFGGEVLHSTGFGSGADHRGRRALVIGSGTSGHDIAQDLHDHGARVTMLQRGSMTVASVRAVWEILDASYAQLPQAEADLLGASFAYPTFLRVQQDSTRRLREADAELLAGLAAAGFAEDAGPDGTGPALKYLRQAGGFYLNVGCSDLIAAGAIEVIGADRVAGFEPGGLRLADGGFRELDLVMAATGYEPPSAGIARLLGAEIAGRLGDVWGIDETGLPRNVWRPTPVEGLWFMMGNIQQSRFYSRLLAVQLAARLRPRPGWATPPQSTNAS